MSEDTPTARTGREPEKGMVWQRRGGQSRTEIQTEVCAYWALMSCLVHTGAAAKCRHWLVVARGCVAEKGGNEELRFGAGRKDFMTLPLWLLLLVACARCRAHARGDPAEISFPCE